MGNTIIKVENISKQYRLGEVGTGTLSHDLNRWWHKVRGKEDPYIKIGEENNREVKGYSDYVWSLRDVSFEVKQGEVLGIIGKNGAGKSTLLKILSRVTQPTFGNIKVKGRIASLLEVGTGFHPELTGRENIFLNGAILGMRKAEITSKFDEIVAFSGVERYIDTPVKRYSSGMYVRLAFAVAAHLEPEILIVDEVLAVGDAEFQKKCLGKMGEVAGEGRTVLFVSHNMSAVKTLCKKGIILSRGRLCQEGSIEEIVESYNQIDLEQVNLGKYESDIEDNKFSFLEVSTYNDSGAVAGAFSSNDQITVYFKFYCPKNIKGGRIVLQLLNKDGVIVFASTDHFLSKGEWEKGVHSRRCVISKNLLKKGIYFIKLHAGVPGEYVLSDAKSYLQFNINESEHGSIFPENWPGIIAPQLKWEVNE